MESRLAVVKFISPTVLALESVTSHVPPEMSQLVKIFLEEADADQSNLPASQREWIFSMSSVST